ncbi:MAG: 6-phosphogluconolactonase [Bacteroidota bacterium]
MKSKVKIFRTPGDLAEYFAKELSEKINRAAKKNKPINIALSGGSTPKVLFSILAEKYGSSTRWNYAHLFWVDERCVTPGDAESNFGMTKQLLLDTINIPQEHIHRMRGEDDPETEAERYSREIMQNVAVKNSFPLFDIIILGIGDDGHTASIFPGNERLLDSNKVCETAIHPSSLQKRITLTGKVINNSKEIFFLVTGTKKSHVIEQIFSKNKNSAMFPSSHINSINGKTIWLLDEEAAKNIK